MTGDATDESSSRAAGARHDYATRYHAPVLCNSVVDNLVTDLSGTYVDGTLGGGGHTAALLDTLEEEGRVIGIDRDAEACVEARRRLGEHIERGRLTIVHGNFSDVESLLASLDTHSVDGILLDLGASSHQLDEADRGFSYLQDGPLDMRMNPDAETSADVLVNTLSEQDLRRVLRSYGEEPQAARIARAICSERPVRSTGHLAEIVRSRVRSSEAIKSLSRVFQALRLAVNGEIEALEEALESATRLVRLGGRIAVISYHSLEDRRVKRFLRFGNFAGESRKDVYGTLLSPWNPITKRPVLPGEDELEQNPRSRSAKLRVAERTSHEIDPDRQQR
jgi:16S rRNA (cytosine1402-N4)-methyltransferase